MNECIMCKGNMNEGSVNHIIDIEGNIIIIKNVPAQVCKQCSEYYFEHQTAINIENIVEDAKKSKVEIMVINYYDIVA